MKFSIIVATVSCVLGVALALKAEKVDKAHSEVLAYVHENLAAVPMIRGHSGHLECYNGFIPLINTMALKAKEVSQKCVDHHTGLFDGFWSDLKTQRSLIEAKVETITRTLADCGEKKGLDYFNCLSDNTEDLRQLMEDIKLQSKDIVMAHQDKISKNEIAEETCLLNAVDAAKAESDQAFVNLKACVRNGGPTIDVSPSTAEPSNPKELSTDESVSNDSEDALVDSSDEN